MTERRPCSACHGSGLEPDEGSVMGRAFLMGAMAMGESPEGLEEAQKRIRALELTLAEIALKKGPYSLDPHEHARNCIESMAEIAVNALRGKWCLEVEVALKEKVNPIPKEAHGL